MPGKKPFVRRFGQVDFDSMIALPGAAADDADIFVTRRGAFGANRTLTRAQIVAGAGVVPDPLLLNDGSAAAPTYSFTSDPTSGVFLDGAGINVSILGATQFRWNGGTFRGNANNSGAMLNETATITNPVFSFTGDMNTGIGWGGQDILSFIAGGANFTWDGSVLSMPSGLIHVADVSGGGDPSYSFASAPTTGFRHLGGGRITYMAEGTDVLNMEATLVWTKLGGVLVNEVPSATNPTVVTSISDLDTGLGRATPDQLNLIAGGLTCMSVSESGGARRIGFYEGSPIALQTGVPVTTAAVHAALVALRLITA